MLLRKFKRVYYSLLFTSKILYFLDKLPGPPVNVRVENTDAHTIMVKWDPPAKNPQTVEVYRYDTMLSVLTYSYS